MRFETGAADRTADDTEAAGLAEVVYTVLTSLEYEADGCFGKSRLRETRRMLVVKAGKHIHSVRIRVPYRH